MTESTTESFPTTRRTLDRLDAWLKALAAPFLPAQRRPIGQVGFMWVVGEESERTLMVGKAVRVVSGLRAAMALADLGFIA